VCLRFLYPVVGRLFGWLRLSRRPESWKAAEILLLRHQLTALQRQIDARPKVNWADHAFIALLTDVIPSARRLADSRPFRLRAGEEFAPRVRGHALLAWLA
jgi:hypothetical protein